jgi:CubicO group peptidase (beta-lactamase class C family)
MTDKPREPPAPASLDMLDVRLRMVCDAYLIAAKVPGASIAVIAADKAYHYAYGINAVSHPRPITLHTSFNIGSCSKAFVSATIASLVGEGLASWDEPLSRWVPEFQLYDPAVTAMVTLRDACGNRLGLPRAGLTEYGFRAEVPVDRVFRGLQHTPPIHPLRQRFTYVNAGHTAAAVAAGRITGKGFLATLRERLLEPLGMTGTSGGLAAKTELSDEAGWHVPDGDRIVELPRFYTENYLGSGGMVVSGADALQWLRLHLGGGTIAGREIVARGALLETHRPQAVATPGKDITSLFNPESHLGSYALGWAVCDLAGEPMVIHSGSDQGVCAITLLLPRKGIGIAVYLNLFTGSVVPLAYALAATLIGMQPPRDWSAFFAAAGKAIAPPTPREPEPGVEPQHPLPAYAGVYEHPADGELRINLNGVGLMGDLVDGHAMTFRLAPLGDNEFAVYFDQLPGRVSLMGFRLVFECNASTGQAHTAVMHLHTEATRVFKIKRA